MYRQAWIGLMMVALLLAAEVLAQDLAGIEKNVNALIAAMATGRDPSGFAADAYTPYVFVMQEDGRLLVHPTLAGEDLRQKARPIYEALMRATPEGVWVHYFWKEKEKHTFAKRYGEQLIVASGY